MRDFDVIVLGSGIAGLAAATEAAQAKARVLLVEAAPKVGGTSALSTGVVYAAGTSVQRALGIEDSPEAMLRYAVTLNAFRCAPSLLNEMAQRSADALEWLISLGVEFSPDDLYISGAEDVPRGHRARNNGLEIVTALDQAANVAGVTFALGTRVRRLLFEAGAVCGIEVDGERITASTVIVATGGFGNNPELLARHYPDAAVAENPHYVGSEYARGDGLTMGLAVGAEVGGHNNGIIQLSTGLVKDLESYFPGWVIFVNRDGRRFVNENAPYGVMSWVVQGEPANEAFAVFDEAARASAKVITTYKPLAPSWTSDQLAQFIAQGRIAQAESLDRLAERIGVRQSTFLTTVENYNRDAERGVDSGFFKNPAYLRKIGTPPFYAVRLRSTTVSYTAAGLRIDTDARVLDASDRPIPGLRAAGEVTCALPARYIGGGCSLTNNLVFGRIAGIHAARDALAGGFVS